MKVPRLPGLMSSRSQGKNTLKEEGDMLMGEKRWDEAAQRYTECMQMQTASAEEQPIDFKALGNRTQARFRDW